MNRQISRAVVFALAAGAIPLAAHAQDQDANEPAVQQVVVTGSRIMRPDYEGNSPVATVSSEQILGNSDVTLDTFLNTLPQVVPAGTTTSNNPPNAGQSNVDLRGLGANRNLVLLDGRRAMVSAATMTVDLNTIPQALIDSVEVVSGGAGAVYGADAVAGAVNIKLKRDFQGFDLHSTFSNSTAEWDSKEYSVDALLGSNLSEDRGNVVLGFDYSNREGLIKAQRQFAAIATSTTSFLPEGLYLDNSNGPSQAAVDAVFASYGVAAGAVKAGNSLLGFNADGTLFSRGVFNNKALDVQNFRYDQDLAVNSRLFPDLYSYNFDAVNILTLPLERRSIMSKLNYQLSDKVEMFGQIGWTEYNSETALAPTPIPTVTTAATGEATPQRASSSLLVPGKTVSNAMIVPANNPFIPQDLATLLASRTGDNASLLGSGANEAFLMRQRTLTAGLRSSEFNNDVIQYLLGVKGSIVNSWRWEAYASEGHTKISTTQSGNIDTDVLQQLLEAPDGGQSRCAGGFDPFGRNPISQECRDILEVTSTITNDFRQQIVQGFVSGDVANLSAGAVSVVVGLEYRRFNYELDPGANAGPVSGFTTLTPAGGRNSFSDVFSEALIPLVRDKSWARSIDLNVGYRFSKSQFSDTVNHVDGKDSNDSSYKAELSWQPLEPLRLRASYQRAVRAPNFAELFNGGGSNPQYFDPCSVSSQARHGANAAALRSLCVATGLSPTAVDTYEQTPGSQIALLLNGNTQLKPEKANTLTFGAVFNSPWTDGALAKLRGSIDYYSIAIADPILAPPSPNVYVADCYNYYGTNPNYSADNRSCGFVARAGGDILQIVSPDDPENGIFPTINAGRIKTSGIDFQADYGFDLEQVGAPARAGSVTFNLLLSRLLEFKQRDSAGLPMIDYSGTVSYFGEGISIGGGGSTYPDWRASLLTRYNVGDFRFDIRGRWIDSMKNRASVQYVGETQFTGVGSVAYWDVGATWNLFKSASFRLGVNNVFNKQPPVYAPNVQSGTDPSMYDVIGRRLFGQFDVKF